MITFVGIDTVYGNIMKKTLIGVIIPEVTMIAISVKQNVIMIQIALVLNVEEMLTIAVGGNMDDALQRKSKPKFTMSMKRVSELEVSLAGSGPNSCLAMRPSPSLRQQPGLAGRLLAILRDGPPLQRRRLPDGLLPEEPRKPGSVHLGRQHLDPTRWRQRGSDPSGVVWRLRAVFLQ